MKPPLCGSVYYTVLLIMSLYFLALEISCQRRLAKLYSIEEAQIIFDEISTDDEDTDDESDDADSWGPPIKSTVDLFENDFLPELDHERDNSIEDNTEALTAAGPSSSVTRKETEELSQTENHDRNACKTKQRKAGKQVRKKATPRKRRIKRDTQEIQLSFHEKEGLF